MDQLRRINITRTSETTLMEISGATYGKPHLIWPSKLGSHYSLERPSHERPPPRERPLSVNRESYIMMFDTSIVRERPWFNTTSAAFWVVFHEEFHCSIIFCIYHEIIKKHEFLMGDQRTILRSGERVPRILI